MCDTIAIVKDSEILFAKNSDRDGNEAQVLEWHPRAVYPAGATVNCTHIDIPQAREINAILISRPFWMWGAEIGANEHGVTIGNEAIFSNQPFADTGLLGMDLIRLALERAATAQEACELITTLLERHGQGGACGHENRKFTYHNSFIIADPCEAYVLETAGRQWAVEAISGARTISNRLSIPAFRSRYDAKIPALIADADSRCNRTQLLANQTDDVPGLIRILRDYGAGMNAPNYHWLNGAMAAPCMHAGGLLAASQTTASWVAALDTGHHQHWVTGTSIPSLSLFKPVRVDTPMKVAPTPTDKVDSQSLWWKHERFARQVLRDPERFMADFCAERDDIEQKWLNDPPSTEEAFLGHHELLDRWNDKLKRESICDRRPWYVRRYWKKRDKMAGL